MSKKLTTKEFIERAKNVHGDKYDYSKVNYINCEEKVCIICPIHGEFWQIAKTHLKGGGCYLCGIEKVASKKRLGIKTFIEKAKIVHGDKYDYSKTEYLNSQTPIIITCPIHGEFTMRPNDHLQGQGCPKCKLLNLRKKFSMPKEQFIQKAKEVHGDKYNYSKVEYINNHTKVCIICPKHGEFWQTPDKHIQGRNCPKCNSSKLEEKIRKLMEDNNIDFLEQFNFPWFNSPHMRVDFYLPQKKLVIECQGIQHFKPVERFGGVEGFKECFNNDKIKYEKCKENGIKIIYYTELPNYFTFLNERLIKSEKELLEYTDLTKKMM